VSSSLWEKCLSHLEGELTPQQLNTWLRPLQAIETDEGLTLLAPNPYVQAWVHEQLQSQIDQLAGALSNGAVSKVVIEVGKKPSADPTPVKKDKPSMSAQSAQPEADKAQPAVGSPINPLFTFNSFVEGKSNQIARAASLHVAEAPGTSGYNPLFLYGGTGLGKTHLMLAVGNKIKKR
jgi:chromosomal replication initiator protein